MVTNTPQSNGRHRAATTSADPHISFSLPTSASSQHKHTRAGKRGKLHAHLHKAATSHQLKINVLTAPTAASTTSSTTTTTAESTATTTVRNSSLLVTPVGTRPMPPPATPLSTGTQSARLPRDIRGLCKADVDNFVGQRNEFTSFEIKKMCTRLVQYATRLDAWLYAIQRRNLGDEQIKTLLFDRLQQDTRYKRIFCDESFIANRNKLAAFMSTVTSEELFDFSAVPVLLYDSNGEVKPDTCWSSVV